ncbi:unnamed protein product [Caenorhabditis auriculariae]|uniref:Ubiquilin n=1 Tax=Caenorhabditis auriculariae TaxID=2777116 RepID=A0A8S1GML0_9PELO|nr:unnamed protein product [Caenorhabditis auriculariae]
MCIVVSEDWLAVIAPPPFGLAASQRLRCFVEMAENEEDQLDNITLNAKTPTQTYTVKVRETTTISELKDKLIEIIPNATKEQLCVIYTGKILKDPETVTQHKIGNGHTVHIVVRSGQRAQPPPANPSAAAPAEPQIPRGGLPQMGDLMNNRDIMRQMLDTPLFQSMMNNQDLMRNILSSSPEVQRLIENNPEVGHLLNDPNIMRQTMEMIRNPNMFQEMMRNHDIAIRNLQGIPGGEAALERLYQDVQEPLLNSATSTLGGNPFASLRNQNAEAESRSQRAGVENTEALPNPWSSSTPSAPRNTAENSSAAAAGLGNISGMLNAPGMNSLMQQMMSDPNIRSQILSPEMMNTVRQGIESNPELMETILAANPAVQANPALRDSLRTRMPEMFNMVCCVDERFSRNNRSSFSMRSPEYMQAMANPRVVEALQQIQTSYDVLRREAPVLLGSFNNLGGLGGLAPNRPTDGASNRSGIDPMPQLEQLLGQMGFPSNNERAATANPEQMYATQLEQLSSMGFNNRAANIAALTAAFGDLNAAVERLLNSPQ